MFWPRNVCRRHKPRTMLVKVEGSLAEGVTAKDLALGIIGKIGTDGASGHVIEYAGEAVRGLSMEGRMTLCNMSIEGGARAGMIAPDECDLRLSQRPALLTSRNTMARRRRELANITFRSDGRQVRSCGGDRCERDCTMRHLGYKSGNGDLNQRATCPNPSEATIEK